MLRLSEIKKMAKYALVGGLNTGVDFAVFVTLVYASGFGSALAQTISYAAGVVNSYLLNRYWTFEMKAKRSYAELARFIAINVLSFAAATAVLLGLEALGAESALAKLVSVAFSMTINYMGFRLWVFRGMEADGKRAH
ncbi:GtrA family protein [Cohnella suwonensis]|uniref:GtrA family protein n=1 Tax=Cohnella suwonensis TaxID=696072 RepID=A0ABW0LXB2_9BACL